MNNIEIAPIIHSRTYNCDFIPDFMVYPRNLKSDLDWIQKKVLLATSSMDIMSGSNERWVILKKGNCFVVGLVCLFDDLIKKCQYLNEQEKDEFQKYTTDKNQRYTYGFIGFSIKNIHENEIVDLDYDTLLRCLIYYLKDVWKESNVETRYSSYASGMKIKDTTNKTIPEYIFKNSDITIFNSGSDDKILFEHYFNEAIKEHELTFCTNMDSTDVISKEEFSVITTSVNNIEQLIRPKHTSFSVNREQNGEPTNSKENTYRRNSALNESKGGYFRNPKQKKTTSLKMTSLAKVILVLILLIIIVIYFIK